VEPVTDVLAPFDEGSDLIFAPNAQIAGGGNFSSFTTHLFSSCYKH
jgi:hypothetical protein